MFAISMKAVSVGSTSLAERMNIFEVVMGSNHFLIQPQTVGKNEGAPMIWSGSQPTGGNVVERGEAILFNDVEEARSNKDQIWEIE